MTVFTNVSDDVLEPGDPIRSVDILAIKENTNYLKQFNDFSILDTQIFTASGTWTKPEGFDATDTVVSLVIGGGGSGGAARSSNTINRARGGGGGGGVAIFTKAFGDIASAVSVTVGAGGASVTSTTTNVAGDLSGNTGGDSIFDGDRATGGQGGGAVGTVDGTGGGSQKSFGNSTGIEGLINSGGNGRTPNQSTVVTPIPYGLTGGGGAAANSSSTLRNQNIQAMTGALFGDGGNGSTNAVGAAGVAPGGGGGGCIRINVAATSGAGARGEVQVYVVRGRVTGEQLLGVSL